MSLLFRRLRRLLHGALHLPPGNAAQLAVAETGQRIPHRGVRECWGPAHQDHQRLARTQKFHLVTHKPHNHWPLNMTFVSVVFPRQPCRPCLTHTTSRRWTRTSPRGSSLLPSPSDPVLTDLPGVSIAAVPRWRLDLTFLGRPPAAVSISDVCGLFMATPIISRELPPLEESIKDKQ